MEPTDGANLALYLTNSTGKCPLTVGHATLPRSFFPDLSRQHNIDLPIEDEWNNQNESCSFWYASDSTTPWAHTRKCIIGRDIDAAIGNILTSSSNSRPLACEISVDSARSLPPPIPLQEYSIQTPSRAIPCEIESDLGMADYQIWLDPVTHVPVYHEVLCAVLKPRPGHTLPEHGDSGSLVSDSRGNPAGMLIAAGFGQEGVAICSPLPLVASTLF
mgnify:CR=1 FL=1